MQILSSAQSHCKDQTPGPWQPLASRNRLREEKGLLLMWLEGRRRCPLHPAEAAEMPAAPGPAAALLGDLRHLGEPGPRHSPKSFQLWPRIASVCGSATAASPWPGAPPHQNLSITGVQERLLAGPGSKMSPPLTFRSLAPRWACGEPSAATSLCQHRTGRRAWRHHLLTISGCRTRKSKRQRLCGGEGRDIYK